MNKHDENEYNPYVEYKPKRGNEKLPIWREVLRSPVIAAFITAIFSTAVITIIFEVTNVTNFIPDEQTSVSITSTSESTTPLGLAADCQINQRITASNATN